MADIRVGVSIDVADSSLRNLQQEITRTVSSISPQINLDIDERRLGRLINNQLGQARFELDNLDLSSNARSILRTSLQRTLDNLLIERIGFDPRARARLRKQLEAALSDVQVGQVADLEAQLSRLRERRETTTAPRAQAALTEQIQSIEKDLESRSKRISDTLTAIAKNSEARLAFERQQADITKRQTEEQRRQFSFTSQLPQITQRRIAANQQATNQDERLAQILQREVRRRASLETGQQQNTDRRRIRDAIAQRAQDEERLAQQVRARLATSRAPQTVELPASISEIRAAQERRADAAIKTASAELAAAEESRRTSRERQEIAQTELAIKRRIISALSEVRAASIEQGNTSRQISEQSVQRLKDLQLLRSDVELLSGLNRQNVESVRLQADVAGRIAQIDAEAARQANIRAQLERDLQSSKRDELGTQKQISSASIDRLRQLRAQIQKQISEAGPGAISPVGTELPSRDIDIDTRDANRRVAEELKKRESAIKTARQVERESTEQEKRTTQEVTRLADAAARRARSLLESGGFGATGGGERSEQTLNEILRKRVAQVQEQLGFDEVVNTINRREQAAAREKVNLLARERALFEERLGINKRISEQQVNALQGELQIDSFREAEREARRRLVANIRKRAEERFGPAQRAAEEQAGRAGQRTITFRGADDISRFGQQLRPDQLERFVRVLNETITSGRGASKAIREFQNTIARGTPTVDRLRASLSAGNQAAFDFGVRTAQAARRLLEWASPAQFIFATIARLRQAVDTITELDTQARRLEFFSSASGVEIANQDMKTFAQTVSDSRGNLEDFLAVSRRTGIAVEDISEALVTAARVGVDVSNTLDKVRESAVSLGRGFEQTVLQLVRLEAGALSSEQAVRRLRSIQAQFLNTLSLSVDVSDQAISNIGDSLQNASANSTFSVDELANATSRLGTSLERLQGANPQAAIRLIADAAKATGAEPGRLSTTFRQLTTLTVQNAERIRRATGGDVQIVDPQTGQQTFEGQLEFLRELSRLQETDALAADRFARLGTDRRNVNELKQFAAAIDELSGNFETLTDNQARVEKAGQNAVEAFRAEQNLSDSLQGSFNRLDAEIAQLVQTTLSSEEIGDLVDVFTDIVGGVGKFVDALKEAEPVLRAILAFVVTTAAPRIVSAFAGVGASLRDALTGGNFRAQIDTSLAKASTAVEGVNRARKEGLITSKQQAQLNRELLGNTQAIAVSEGRIQDIDRKIAAEKGRTVRDESKIQQLQKQRAREAGRLANAAEREAQARERIRRDFSRTRRSFSAIPGALGGVAAAAALIGPEIARSFGDSLREEGKDFEAAGIEGAVRSAVIGGFAGASLGPIGAIAGAAGGAAFGGISGLEGEAKKREEEALRALEEQRRKQQAIAAQREVIAARERRSAEFAESRTKAENELLTIQQQIAKQQVKVQATEGDRQQQQEAFARLNELQVEFEERKAQLQREQFDIQARQLAIAAERASITRREEDALQRLSILQASVVQGLDEEQEIRIGLAFSSAEIQKQISAIGEEIELELDRQQTVEVRTDNEAFEKSRQRVLDLQAEERQLQLKQAQQEIEQRRELVDLQKEAVGEQVDDLKQAGENIASALEDVFKSQLELVELISKAGEISSKSLMRTGEAFLSNLEQRGASIAERLEATRRQSAQQIRDLRRTQQITEAALGATGVDPLDNVREINEAFGRVNEVIIEAAERSADEIFDGLSGQFDRELLELRERQQLERDILGRRVKQTRTEIEARRDLLSQEIEIIQKRAEAERELQDELRQLRINQQREFGRILLRGPEEFNKAITQLQQARGFLGGLQEGGGGITANQITEIARRAVRLRDLGQFEALQGIQQGIKNAISTGQGGLVGGINNEELLGIFEQAVSTGIPGGASPEDIILQLEQQRRSLEEQADERRAIRQREEELLRLAQRDAQLQEAQIRLNQTSVDIERLQRERILSEAELRLQELVNIREILAGFVRDGIKIAAGATPDTPSPGGLPGGPTPDDVEVDFGDVGGRLGNILDGLGRATTDALQGLNIDIAQLPEGLREAVRTGLEEGDVIDADKLDKQTNILEQLLAVNEFAREASKEGLLGLRDQREFEPNIRRLVGANLQGSERVQDVLNEISNLPGELANIDLGEISFEEIRPLINDFRELTSGLRDPRNQVSGDIPGFQRRQVNLENRTREFVGQLRELAENDPRGFRRRVVDIGGNEFRDVFAEIRSERESLENNLEQSVQAQEDAKNSLRTITAEIGQSRKEQEELRRRLTNLPQQPSRRVIDEEGNPRTVGPLREELNRELRGVTQELEFNIGRRESLRGQIESRESRQRELEQNIAAQRELQEKALEDVAAIEIQPEIPADFASNLLRQTRRAEESPSNNLIRELLEISKARVAFAGEDSNLANRLIDDATLDTTQGDIIVDLLRRADFSSEGFQEDLGEVRERLQKLGGLGGIRSLSPKEIEPILGLFDNLLEGIVNRQRRNVPVLRRGPDFDVQQGDLSEETALAKFIRNTTGRSIEEQARLLQETNEKNREQKEIADERKRIEDDFNKRLKELLDEEVDVRNGLTNKLTGELAVQPRDIGAGIPDISREALLGNVEFNRGGRGIRIVSSELQELRRAIARRGGDPTSRQARQLAQLERQQDAIGSFVTTREGQSLQFDPGAARELADALVEDPTRRRGVETQFRELLRGDTGFIQDLRALTQTEGGEFRVASRGRRELDIPQFQDLLRDAGLTGLAEEAGTRNEATTIANQLLGLTRAFEEGQGRIGREQVRLLEQVLTQELSGTFENVRDDFKNVFEATSRLIGGQREDETTSDFRERRAREQRNIARDTGREIAQNLSEGAFRESIIEVGSALASRLEESDERRAESIRELLDNLSNLSVNVEGEARVNLNAAIENNIRADERFINSLREAIPNVSQRQLDALIDTITVLIKAERSRGTKLPSSAGDLNGNGNE